MDGPEDIYSHSLKKEQKKEPLETFDLRIGQELQLDDIVNRLRQKKGGKLDGTVGLVFGRIPNTDNKKYEANPENEIQIRLLSTDGFPIPGMHRRILRLVPTEIGYNLTDLADSPIETSKNIAEDGHLKPHEPVFIEKWGDYRDTRIQMGAGVELRAGAIEATPNGKYHLKTLQFKGIQTGS